MKKYIIARRDLISIDDENIQNIECIDNCSTGIDWAWIAPYDGELNGEPVKEGEVIIKFYGNGPDLPSGTYIIREPNVCEHIRSYNNVRPTRNTESCESCEPCENYQAA